MSEEQSNEDYWERSWPEYNDYQCTCRTCKKNFGGHKRQAQCKVCADNGYVYIVRDGDKLGFSEIESADHSSPAELVDQLLFLASTRDGNDGVCRVGRTTLEEAAMTLATQEAQIMELKAEIEDFKRTADTSAWIMADRNAEIRKSLNKALETVESHEDALSTIVNTCGDVTNLGRFSRSVDPVRWVTQLQEFARSALNKTELGE